MPKVSVIMPVHNEPEMYLRTAINSILKQTFTDFEFIIIDDCSESYVADIIKSYDDERIRYYRNDINLKVIKTLNKGLSLVTGEYIARMDADDIAFRTRFEKQVQLLDNNPDIGLVNAQCYLFPKFRLITPPEKPLDVEMILKYEANCVVHPLVMFRKSVIDENNMKYNENFLHIEDYKFWDDFIKVSKIYTIQEPLLLHRDWANSVSNKNLKTQIFNAQSLTFGMMLEDLGIQDPELLYKYTRQLDSNYISLKEFSRYDEVIQKSVAKMASLPELKFRVHIVHFLNELRKKLYNKINWTL